MKFKYQTGEEIRKGDRVLFHREPAVIDLLVSEPGDSETDWYLKEFGGGIGIVELFAGRTFIPVDEIETTEDLEFVSRAGDPATLS